MPLLSVAGNELCMSATTVDSCLSIQSDNRAGLGLQALQQLAGINTVMCVGGEGSCRRCIGTTLRKELMAESKAR